MRASVASVSGVSEVSESVDAQEPSDHSESEVSTRAGMSESEDGLRSWDRVPPLFAMVMEHSGFGNPVRSASRGAVSRNASGATVGAESEWTLRSTPRCLMAARLSSAWQPCGSWDSG